MRGKVHEEQLWFDPKIEWIAHRNNRKTIKAKLLAKKKELEESIVSKQETMENLENNNNGGRILCRNSKKQPTCIVES